MPKGRHPCPCLCCLVPCALGQSSVLNKADGLEGSVRTFPPVGSRRPFPGRSSQSLLSLALLGSVRPLSCRVWTFLGECGPFSGPFPSLLGFLWTSRPSPVQSHPAPPGSAPSPGRLALLWPSPFPSSVEHCLPWASQAGPVLTISQPVGLTLAGPATPDLYPPGPQRQGPRLPTEGR